MPKAYTVSDGKMVLTLHPAEEGGYTVTSPFDPEMITEAETIEEAFYMARDATKLLAKARIQFRKDKAKLELEMERVQKARRAK